MSKQGLSEGGVKAGTGMARIKQAGRILASGALFLLLGLGGLLFSALFLPLLRRLPGGPAIRQRRARAAIHKLFRAFVFGLEGSGILRLETAGLPVAEQLDGRLILANHPGYLDVVLLLSVLPNAVCVVKEGVWNNPFFGQLIQEAGYVRNLDPSQCLADASQALGRGHPVILFPEGTRTVRGRPLAFRRGAAHLALQSGVEILPMLITCEPPLLEKGNRWYDLPVCTCLYRVQVQAPFAFASDTLLGLPPPMAARRLSKLLEGYFQRLCPVPPPFPLP